MMNLNSSIVIIVIAVGLFTACGCGPAGGEIGFNDVHHFYADVTGGFVVYLVTPSYEGTPYNSKSYAVFGKTPDFKTVLASIPSGETLVEYENSNPFMLFSPDGKQVLKQGLSTGYLNSTGKIGLYNTKDDSKVWEKKLAFDFKVDPCVNIAWDRDRGWLILCYRKTPPQANPMRAGSGEYWTERNQKPNPLLIYVLDLDSGEEKAKLTLNFILQETFNGMDNVMRYADGRIFVAAQDDPLKEERKTGPYSTDYYHIYAIDPETEEVEKYDMSGIDFFYNTGFFVDNTGSKVFYRDRLGPPDGESVFEMDLSTGESRKIAEGIYHHDYSLHGIALEGSVVCLSEVRQDDTGITGINACIFDLALDEIVHLEQGLGGKYLNELLLDSSGKYLLEWQREADIWLYDIDAGTTEPFIQAPEGYMVYAPHIPGSWNGHILTTDIPGK